MEDKLYVSHENMLYILSDILYSAYCFRLQDLDKPKLKDLPKKEQEAWKNVAREAVKRLCIDKEIQ